MTEIGLKVTLYIFQYKLLNLPKNESFSRQTKNAKFLRYLRHFATPCAGCFSISQLPHGNAYLIGKEKRSGIDYFFAGSI